MSEVAGKGGQFDLFGAAAARPAAPPEPVRSVPPLPPVAPALVPQPSPEAPAFLTVSELTGQIKGILDGSFSRVAVSGELSNCRRQSSGHLYFTLKDAGATLGAAMWRQSGTRLKFEPRDGLQVVCHGRLEVYPPHGKYQLIADRMEPLGAGALALAFEQLKEMLEREGLFAASRKRQLPFLPRGIGVVTSPTGAALRDFLRVLHLRFPGLPVLVVPVKVQGEGAGAEIAAAIGRLSRRPGIDVVVVTRGGGSMEDLWAFNEEVVARAIAGCRVPVVSGVGHEIDFTIADFAADRRAPTPTGAAELLAPVRSDLETTLVLLGRRLQRGLQGAVQRRREQILKLRFRLGDPRRSLAARQLALAELEERLSGGLRGVLEGRRMQLRRLKERIDQRNPRADLAARTRRLHALSAALVRAGQRSLGLQARQVALAQLEGRLSAGALGALQGRRQQLRVGMARLEAISPQRVFERGYSMTRLAASGKVLRASTEVRSGEQIEVVLGLRIDGANCQEDSVRAVVETTSKGPGPPDSSGG